MQRRAQVPCQPRRVSPKGGEKRDTHVRDGGQSWKAIHRLIQGLPTGTDLLGAFGEWFDLAPTTVADQTVATRMAEAEALALVTPAGTWLARPRPLCC